MKITSLQVIRHLSTFASAFSKIETLDQLVQSVEDILENTFDFEYNGLYLFDPSLNCLKLFYAKGFNKDEQLEAEKSAMDRYPGQVFRSATMLYIPDVLLETNHQTISSKHAQFVRSRLFLPVMNGNQTVGVFGFAASKPDAYTEEDIAILSFICNTSGAIYGNLINQSMLKIANEKIVKLAGIPGENPSPVLRIGYNGILLYANNSSSKLLQYYGLAENKKITGIFSTGLSDVMNTGKPVEYEVTDGVEIYSLFFTPVEAADYINVYGREITKRKALETELDKMALIARETNNSVVITNTNGEIEWVNDAFTNLTGYEFNEVKGKIPGRVLQGEETDPKAVVLMAEAIQNKKAIEIDVINYTKSHRKYWIRLQIQPVFDQKGELKNFIAIQKEITREKETEQELLRTTTLQKAILDSSEIAIISTDLDGTIQSFNPAACNMLGYTPQETIGKLTPRNFHDEEELRSRIKSSSDEDVSQLKVFSISEESAPEQAKNETGEFTFVRKDGSKFPVSLIVTALRNSDKKISGFLAMAENITKRKQDEEQLRKISQAVEQSPVMTYITNLAGNIEYANPRVLETTGYTIDEILGKNPRVFSSKTKPVSEYAELWQTISSGKDWKGEFLNRTKSGELYWVLASISPVFDTKGIITHYIAVEENITESKEQFNALHVANLRFKLLISSMQKGVMIEDENRKVILVNQAFCNSFYISDTPENMIGQDCARSAEAVKDLFIHPDIFVRDIENTRALGKIVINHELHMKSGRVLERDFVPINDPGRKNQGILWIYRDITLRKNYERDLKRQSRILSGTAEAMNYLLTLPDHNQAVNLALAAIGTASHTDRVYIFENHPDAKTGKAYFSQKYEWVAEGILPQIDNKVLQNIPFSEGFPRWYDLLLSGKTISGLVKDFPVAERPILEEQNIVSLIVVPIFVNEELWGMVGFDDCKTGIEWTQNEESILLALAGSIGGSITKRIIESELTQARQTAEYATKTKSEFLATMSHEIRTPMNGVIGMTSLLMQTPLNPVQLEYAETIRTSGEILLNLINDILDFSKIESGKMVLEVHNFDLMSAIEDVLDLMSTSASAKNLGLHFIIDPLIPKRINGDLTRLRQILVNLTANAIKFTSNGEVVIEVKKIVLSENQATLQFTVRDTGMGIPEEKIDRLFKSFSQVDASTTRKFGGTGLGLAISARLVKLMKGEIWVTSEVNKGSEFHFTIKTTYQPGEKQVYSSLTDIGLTSGKEVLVIDNHTASSANLCSVLKHIGFRTETADSLSDAAKTITRERPYDMVILVNELSVPVTDHEAGDLKVIHNSINKPVLLISQPRANFEESSELKALVQRINKPMKHSQLITTLAGLFSPSTGKKTQAFPQTVKIQKLNTQFPLNILVAEDNTINQKLILSLFRMLGYTAQIAANGFEVLDSMNHMKFDIIFMDIQMPEMDGLEATKHIIEKWGTQRPLIVAMTANALISDKDNCLAAGMDDYISKPLTIDQVSKGIEKWHQMIKYQQL